MRKIAFLNQKGGVGKTTTTINVGAGLAKLKKKVLLIDLDPQASMTYSLGIQAHELERSMVHVLRQEILIDEIIVKQNNLSIAPSSIELASHEEEMRATPHKKYILRTILSHLTDYDYILIDCPPSLGMLTINVLAAVDEVFIPVQTEFLALQGLSQLLETISVIKKRINPNLKLGGIIGTRVNRRRIHNDVIEYLRTNFKEYTFATVIRESIALAEAPSFGKDIYSHNPNCNGARDYKALCKEIIKKEQPL